MKGSQPLWLRVSVFCRSFARIIGEAFRRYGRINGEQCAASFAYYAFFSLFPLILLLVVVGTFFVPDRLQAALQVVKQVEEYVPLQAEDKAVLIGTIDNAIQNGWRAGIFGFFALIWSALFSRLWSSALTEPGDSRITTGGNSRSRTFSWSEF